MKLDVPNILLNKMTNATLICVRRVLILSAV